MNIFGILKEFYQDFHFFISKRVNSTIRPKVKVFIRRITITCHRLLKLLVFLIKLTASFLVPVSFRCNPPRIRSVTLIFQLSTMPNCNTDRCLFTLFSVSVAFPLPVLLTTFDIQAFDWGNVFSVKLLTDNILSKIVLDMLFGASLVPTCKMSLSGAF